MKETPLAPPYTIDLRARLYAIHATVSVAEIHGIITGIVCAGVNTNGYHWIDAVLGLIVPERDKTTISRNILLQLYFELSAQLNDRDTHFELLLDDSAQLDIRARSLSDWCHGFIAGLRIVGIVNFDHYCAAEPLYHCVEIAKLDHDSIACSQDDITAFNNVAEYVRLGIILIHSEFAGGDTRQRLHELRHMQPFRPEEMVVH